MVALVGDTGFVGSNICIAAGKKIDDTYHSKNIKEACGTNPDLLIYAGLRAEKYLANNAPEEDMKLILQAEENIRKINPKKLVLISTIDVFKAPRYVDETSVIETKGLHAYGYNRYQLEVWVREHYPDALIIRLPALFGKNIKKNFIYDYINVIPSALKVSKFEELSKRAPELHKYYELHDDGFYRVTISEHEKDNVKEIFRNLGFSALNFTDSRSNYQFYNLKKLWADINTAMNAGITLWHPATEPISAAELYWYLEEKRFVNELGGTPTDYNYRTIHDAEFGGFGGYIATKEQIMQEIKEFVQNEMRYK